MQSPRLRFRISLLLALSLLFLGWFHLHHELTAHLMHPDSGCVICVFTGHLSNGATPAALSLQSGPFPYLLESIPDHPAPALIHPFHFALSQRGPPHHTPA